MAKNKSNKRKKSEIEKAGDETSTASGKKTKNVKCMPCDNDGEENDSKPAAAKAAKSGGGGGLDEIDAMFATKKEKDIEQKQKDAEEEKRREEQRKFFKNNRSNSSLIVNVKNAKKKSLTYDRNDTAGLKSKEWVDDGLGGIFDKEGFTGRKEEGCKIFKAHLFNKKGFGTTPQCPFDCDCCYI
mmetsp:Transcript_908/g.1041  ORF Transcript_908/g.1041 Transcript_908/m.1041 type:complete len:184 (+) Transcript_908:59-610(+)